MRVWAFVSQKGGTGKSTLSTHLAVHAVECGEKVLIVDLDPQGSTEAWHQERGTDRHPGALRCKPEKLQDVLAKAEGFFSLVMVDTVPHTDRDALGAVRAADLIIVPIKSSLFDVKGLELTALLLANADRKTRAIVVVNQVPPGKESSERAAFEKAATYVNEYGLALAKTYICTRQAYISTTWEGKGVTEAGGDKKAAQEIRNLWSELKKASPAVVARKEKVR